MGALKVAINGFGRIGRAAFRQLIDAEGVEICAVNDLTTGDELAYLLRFDSVYGRCPRSVTFEDGQLLVGDKSALVLNEPSLERLPWQKLGVDVVIECTGVHTGASDLKRHIAAGARFVVLSAPAKDGDVPTVVHGVNSAADVALFSCASCTTNAITPVIEILGRRVGVLKATMTTVHAYTAKQAVVDRADKDRRRGRAAAVNLVPATTGAARATSRALPQYAGKFSGVAIRAPVPVGSIADIVCVVARKTSVEEVNALFREEASSDRYKDVVAVSDEQLVSSDIIGDSHAAIIDATLTQVVEGDLVKVFSWYDNEWGYAAQLVREILQLAGR